MEKTVEEIDKECTEIIMTHMRDLYEKNKDNPKILNALKALAFGGFHPYPDGKTADWQILEAAKSLQRLYSTLGWLWDLNLDCDHKWTKLTPDFEAMCGDCGIKKSILGIVDEALERT